MRLPAGLGFVAGLILTLSVAGCSKKSGLAVVLEKEHIAAGEVPPSPSPQQSASPGSPTPETNEVVYQETELRELGEDEIDVDGHVMKKDVRGTSKDPRARVNQEQWIVNVQMIDNLLRIKVQTDQPRWERVKVGDRIKVTYRQGKYTGTVWGSEIN
jgi:hypothetical protein